jgi:hypothetical protein
LLTVDPEREVNRVGAIHFRHPLERLYSSLINMDGDYAEEKDRLTKLLEIHLDQCDMDHQSFFLWCLVMDERSEQALKVYEKFLNGKAQDMVN